MQQSAFTEEQITDALHQVEMGTAVAEVGRQLGVSEPTFYRWKCKFAGGRLGTSAFEGGLYACD
jgi:putative transposase